MSTHRRTLKIIANLRADNKEYTTRTLLGLLCKHPYCHTLFSSHWFFVLRKKMKASSFMGKGLELSPRSILRVQ